MDPFTIALATFGVQKLRGKSTKRALRDAAILGGGAYGLGQLGGIQAFQGAPLSSLGLGTAGTSAGAAGLQATTGTVAANSPFATAGASSMPGYIAPQQSGLGSLLTKFKETSPGTKIAMGAALLPLLEGEEEPVKPPFSEEDYTKAYKEQAAKLEGAFQPTENAVPTMEEVWGADMFYANEGGLAEVVKKFNTGGVNYLPSKIDHDENDYNNYVKADGYVEDGTGNGHKDKDTMLAQLADGEFVSRADAVLGAGILSGANPNDMKKMREQGATFFYDQQKKFKRIYDLTHASKTN
jgi:hypothetical protein